MAHYQTPVGNQDYCEATVVIIGAGISGLCMAIDLIRQNDCRNIVILEKSGGIGGTWRDNRYPGCCCDVKSHLYSYSFAPNSSWSREYPTQEEILDYLTGVAEKFQLYRHIRFNSTVDNAIWDETTQRWNIEVTVSESKDAEYTSKYTIASQFLVSGVGQLNVPNYTDIPGLDTFGGKLMHSARWDWTFPLEGKRIGIIGNGASAAQIIPELAKVAERLTVFQRTPSWVTARNDRPISATRQLLYKYMPASQRQYRMSIMRERETFHEIVAHPDSEFARRLEKESQEMMRSQIPKLPQLWKLLTPSYPIGCKRIIISDDYFPTFARENVELEAGRINAITSKGVQVENHEYELDVLIMATGFRTVEFLDPINVSGKGGRSLKNIWKSGGRALYGIGVESLPNFAMLYGPNTNLGHNSIILMIEQQSRYISTLIKAVIDGSVRGENLVLTPNNSKIQQYNEQIQATLTTSTFASSTCRSWYKTKEGLITNNWSGNVVEYQKILSSVRWNDYDSEGSAYELQDRFVGRVVEEGYDKFNIVVVVLAVTAVVAAPLWKYSLRF